MTTIGFVSRNDKDSVFNLGAIFLDSDKYVYFIENTETHQWVTKEHIFTSNPREAMRFKSEGKAVTYLVENRLVDKLRFYWEITEHELI